MSKEPVKAPKKIATFKLISGVSLKMFEEIGRFLYYLVYYSMLYIFPFAFFFFLVFTVALRDRDTKLKIGEITKCLFKKLF